MQGRKMPLSNIFEAAESLTFVHALLWCSPPCLSAPFSLILAPRPFTPNIAFLNALFRPCEVANACWSANLCSVPTIAMGRTTWKGPGTVGLLESAGKIRGSRINNKWKGKYKCDEQLMANAKGTEPSWSKLLIRSASYYTCLKLCFALVRVQSIVNLVL